MDSFFIAGRINFFNYACLGQFDIRPGAWNVNNPAGLAQRIFMLISVKKQNNALF